MNIEDRAGLVKANILLILSEEHEISDLKTEYEAETAKTILKLKPKTETEYKLAELQALIEHKDTYNKILKKQNEVDSHKTLLQHKDEVLVEYEKYKNQNKEILDLLDKLLGDD